MNFDENIKMIQQGMVSASDFNETLKRLRETKITVNGTLFFGQDDGQSPARIIDSTVEALPLEKNRPQELTFAKTIEIQVSNSLPDHVMRCHGL